MAKLNLNCSLPVSILKEGDYFVAYTPALDISTYGKNFEQTKKRFNELVEIFFEELIEKGTLDEVLSELGWVKIQKKWSPPLIVAHETEKVNIPLCS